MKNFYKKGMTIVEVLIVIVVLGAIFLIVAPQFSKIRENQVIKSGVEDLVSSLDQAHGDTLSSLNSSEYGVHFQSDKVIIFKGKIFSSEAPDNKTTYIVSPASITNVTFNGVSSTSGDVYFSRLSGAPSVTGTITISTDSYSKIITISATGVASVN